MLAFLHRIKKATASLVAMSLVLGALPVHAQSQGATAPGTKIENTASVSYQLSADASPGSSRTPVSQAPSAVFTTFVPHPLAIALGAAVTDGADFNLSAGAVCLKGGSPVASEPRFVSGSSVKNGDQIAFKTASSLKSGDALFVEVFDNDANKNGTGAETIDVTLTTPTNDQERVRLVETGADTGRFVGYVQTGRGTVTQGNCVLTVQSNQLITAVYHSAAAVQATVQTNILVDPVSVVFDSVSGKTINGVSVTLVDAVTLAPAVVYGDDGVSAYPNTVVSGNAVTDASGTNYPGVAGQFRFPLVKPGTYRIVVNATKDLAYPSQYSVADLQSKFSGTYVVNDSSKGAPFTAGSILVQIDIPVDATGGKLVVSKSVSNVSAAIGEFVRYTVAVTNHDKSPVANVVMRDRLPTGFRLRANSFTVGTSKATVVQDEAGNFSFAIGTMAPGATVTMHYVTEVTVQTPIGKAKNLANATGVSAVSNDAMAQVEVRDDLMSDRFVILGNVREVESCKKLPGKPLSGVRILFETGDYVSSDVNGQWHMDRLRVGNHVARIDPQSIPSGYEPVLCEDTTDFAGSATSRFVRGAAASLKSVEFYLKKTQAKVDADAKAMSEKLSQSILGTLNTEVKEDAVVAAGKSGTEAYSYHAAFLRELKPERKFLFPNDSFSAVTTAIGVALSSPSGEQVRLFVNGMEAPKISYDGVRDDEASKASIHYWSAVPIRDGMNKLEARFYKEGVEVGTASREVTFSSNITNATLDQERSVLVADGRHPIEIAVKLTDEFSRPAYKGLSGSYTLEGGFTSFIDRASGAPIEMLGRLRENQQTFVVGDNGVAVIKLEPAASGGEALLTVMLKDKRLTLRPWIRAANQPWVVVGFAEGTLAHSKISNAIKDSVGGGDLVDSGGRVAFFAKGSISGDLLATIAYDTRAIKQVDPATSSSMAGPQLMVAGTSQDAFQVYGDQSASQKDAVRTGKLYVRIEKDRFYAMFGQTQAGLSITELTKYDRIINGAKTEYRGDRASATAFASELTGVHTLVELNADALSGAYATKTPIKVNTEVVSIVTRSSSQRDRILDRKVLSRYLDYDIDYALGTIRLKQSVQAYDLGFNPNYIRIEFDTDIDVGSASVVGGRVAYKPFQTVEVGVSGVKESGGASDSRMAGVDVRYASKDGALSGSVELANSSKIVDGGSVSGSGYYAQGQYRGQGVSGQLYAKKVTPGFGTSTALAADVGLEKVGGDVTAQISDGLALNGSLSSQKDLGTNAKSEIAELKLTSRLTDQSTGYVGLKRQLTEGSTVSTGYLGNGLALPTAIADQDSLAVTLGAQYALQAVPARLVGQAELPNKVSDVAPRRLRVGGEYDLTKKITLVADHELTQYESASFGLNRVGLKANPWKGGQVQASTGAMDGDIGRAYYRVGADQSFELTQNLTMDLGFASQSWTGGALPKTNVAAGTIVTLEDYKNYRGALVYRRDPFLAQLRAEHLDGTDSKRTFIQGDVYQKLDSRFALTAGFTTERLDMGLSSTRTDSLRLGASYRDAASPLSGLLGVRYANLKQSEAQQASIVVNAMQNYKLNSDWEVFAHQGIKHASATFDGEGYQGLTYLLNAGVTYYLGSKFDISASALRAYSSSAKVGSNGGALALGYTMKKNAHVAVGYQALDRFDRNFAFNEAYVSGIFLRVMIKFDETTLGLNRGSAAELP